MMNLKITPEIKTKIEVLATFIDYGVADYIFPVINTFQEGTFYKLNEYDYDAAVEHQCFGFARIAMHYIFKDILKYSDKQLQDYTDNLVELALEVGEKLHLNDVNIVYSKDTLIQYIVEYLESFVWDVDRNLWREDFK